MIYDIKPLGKPRMTQRDKWNPSRAVLFYNAYKDRVRLAKVTIPPVPRIVFWIPLPASMSKKQRLAMDKQPHLRKPDKDNLEKALLDAVFGKYAETDDSHVWCGWVEKRWTIGAGKIEITDLTGLPLVNELITMSITGELT